MTRAPLAVALAFAVSFASLPAAAEKPSSPAATQTVGIGLAGTGVVLTGVGGYLIYKANQTESGSTGRAGIALLAGGAITAAMGVAVYLGADSPEKPAKPKQAIVFGPNGAGYVRQF